MEALLAFGAALCSRSGWRARSPDAGVATRRPELAAWSAALLGLAAASAALTWGAAAGWDARAFRVYYLFGALLTAPLLGVGSAASLWMETHNRSGARFTSGLRSGLRSPFRCTVRSARASRPPRITSSSSRRGSWRSSRTRSATLAVIAVAIVTIRRRPLGNGLILAGSALPPLAPLYPAWVLRKRPFLWQLQHFFFTEVLQSLHVGAPTNR